jgi:hypothetical protein
MLQVFVILCLALSGLSYPSEERTGPKVVPKHEKLGREDEAEWIAKNEDLMAILSLAPTTAEEVFQLVEQALGFNLRHHSMHEIADTVAKIYHINNWQYGLLEFTPSTSLKRLFVLVLDNIEAAKRLMMNDFVQRRFGNVNDEIAVSGLSVSDLETLELSVNELNLMLRLK